MKNIIHSEVKLIAIAVVAFIGIVGADCYVNYKATGDVRCMVVKCVVVK